MRAGSHILIIAGLVLAAVAAVGLFLLVQPPPKGGSSRPAEMPTPSSSPLPQGHVYRCIVEEPDDINPFTASSPVAIRFVLGMTHDTLLDLDPQTGMPRPALAASYRVDDDGDGCVFTLRDDVRFADGTPMTMEDVLFGWELAAAGHLPMGFVGVAFARVASATALDERRLQVRWKDRHFASLQDVGLNWLVAQRRYFVDRVAAVAARLRGQAAPAVDSREFAQLLQQLPYECGPGTGPYLLPPLPGGWIQGQQLQIDRNEGSWRRTARPGTWNLGGFRLLFRGRGTERLALAKREIDWFMGNLQAELQAHPDLADDFRVLAYEFPTLGLYRAAWNCESGPCADPKVRRALAMLFDRQALADKFPQHRGVPEAFAMRDSPACPTEQGPRFDPGAARAMLREVGFDATAGTPLRLRVLLPNGSAEVEAAFAGFRDVARGVGIEVECSQVDFPAFVAARARGEWDLEIAKQSLAMNGDPYELLHSKGADNTNGYRDAEVDRLALAARREFDPERRAALWRELHTIVLRDQPLTPLLQPRVQMLFNRHIEGAEPGPLGLVPERMWVPGPYQKR